MGFDNGMGQVLETGVHTGMQPLKKAHPFPSSGNAQGLSRAYEMQPNTECPTFNLKDTSIMGEMNR